MNNTRRKELDKAWDLIEEAVTIIESCKDDEEDAFYNLPEGIQASERGETMEAYISQMEDALGELTSAIDTISEIVIG